MTDTKRRWSSRKFISAMVWEGAWTVLLLTQHLNQETFFSLTLITLGGYFASNVAGKNVGNNR